MARKTSRRQLIRYGVASAAAAVLSTTLRTRPGAAAGPNSGRPVELPQPKVLRSKDKVLDVTLTAMPGRVDVVRLNGLVHTRTMECCRATPGKSIRATR